VQLDLRRFRTAGHKILHGGRNSRDPGAKEPIAPQIFWVAGISLLLLAEALILGGLASMHTELRGGGQFASRGLRAPLKAR
jgi:hypothetical protein